jgi:DNA-binding transcriptional MocR family regulator
LIHREAFSTWLRREPIALDPDSLILTVGAQEALELAIDDLLSTGIRAFATEAATYSGALAAARGRNLNVVGLGVDENGLRPDELDECLTKGHSEALYVTPVAQNPLGSEMSEARARDIVKVASKHKALIIEDDIYFAYRRENGLTLKELASDQVYYATSLSNSVTPLLRVGILAPPANRLNALIARHHAMVWSVPPCTAAIAADPRQLAIEILGTERIVPSAAMHVWLPIASATAERFARLALEHRYASVGSDRQSLFSVWDKALSGCPRGSGHTQRGLTQAC